MTKTALTDHTTGAQNLAIRPNELVSVSKLAKNPPRYVNRVQETGERIVLTRNGMPIAGIVPLWVLAMAQSHAFNYNSEMINKNFNGGK